MSDQGKTQMKVHAALGRSLVDLGVDTMFGLIGDANLYMVDSYIRDSGGKFVSVAHETASVAAATGYAQVSGRVGVATVTQGPGLTNTLTALVEGVKSTAPIILLAGDTPTEDREHLQNVNQREFVTATGSGFEELRTPHTLSDDLARAFRRAILERRPIVLNMSLDFQWLDVTYRKPSFPLYDDRTAVPSGTELDNAIGIIAAARRPVVLGGRGAMTPEAKAALIRLAARIEAPLATTLRGRGLFAGEDFNLGVCGTVATGVSTEIVMEADCIIAFGASLNRYTTATGNLTRRKRIIQVNPERAEVGKNITPDAGLVGDPALTADAIVRILDEAEIPPSGFRNDAMKQRIAGYRLEPTVPGKPRTGTVDIRQALLRLNDAVPADRVFVADGGRFLQETWLIFNVQRPRSLVYTSGYAAIGQGMGQAIGAAEAAKGRPTLLVTGDGGLMLGGLAEFNSAVRARLDLIVVVCNDGSYGAEYIQFRNKQMDPSLSIFDWPDFAPVAEALGGKGITVRSTSDLEAAVSAIETRNRTRPLLIDVKLDPDYIPSP